MLAYSISQRKKSQGSKTWYGRTYDSDTGKANYTSLKTERKREAEEWLSRMNATRFAPPQTKQNDVLVRDAVQAYLRGVEMTRGGGSRTVELYSLQLRPLVSWCKSHGVDSILEFSPVHAGEYVATFSGQAPVTVRQKIINIRSFFKWAIETYEVQKANPMRTVKAPKSAISKERHFWTPEQIDAILDAAPSKKHRLFWALMAFAGLRRNEAIAVRPADFREGFLHVTGKGSKFARIPVSDRMRSELERFGEQDPGQPYIGTMMAESVLTNACRKTKFKAEGKPHFHRFRHSFGTNLLRAGASITEVQRLMRHSNVQLTLSVYSHLLPEDLVRAVNLLK